MTRNVLILAAALAAALGGALSCGRDVTPPIVPPSLPPPPPPTLVARLVTPNADDGALVVQLRGNGFSIGTPIAADSTTWLFAENVDSLTMRIVIAGDLKAGVLFTFGAANTMPGSYSATILAAADRQTTARDSLTGYSLTLAP